MDFQKLMQQATANQMMVERKHVRTKQQKEEEKKQTLHTQKLQQKKAVEQLKKMKETAERKQLEYKGLHVASPMIPASTSSGSSKQHTVAGKDVDTATTRRLKSSSTKHSHTGKELPSSSSPSPSSSRLSVPKKKERSSSPKGQSTTAKSGKTGLNGISKTKVKPPPAAVNFQDLMKIAKGNNNLKDRTTKTKVGVVNDTKSQEPPRSSSPVGKSLLEKSKSKREREMKAQAARHKTSEAKRPEGKSSLGTAKTRGMMSPTSEELVRRPLRSPSSTSPTDPSSRMSGCVPSPKKAINKSNNRTSKNSCSSGGGGLKLSHAQQSTSGPAGNAVRGFKTPSLPPSLSRQQQQERLKAAAILRMKQKKPTGKTMTATSFYGAAASRILGDKTSSGMRYGGPIRYTSSWVDEMNDFLKERQFGEDEEEYSDEDDMSDFVEEDEDDDFIDDSEAGNDYSSAIRAIFGYDRRKFAGERFDDRAMESSFSQQEFEEKRSARIGRLEDEEDMRQEREQLQRKRKKISAPIGKGKSLKQMKLSFR